MHICCGPCAVYPADVLRREGHDLRGYFFNPNIHPFQEFTRRRDTLEQWAGDIELPVILDPDYDLEGFLRQTVYRETERCRFCYQLRLERAAKVAKRGEIRSVDLNPVVQQISKTRFDNGDRPGGGRGQRFGFLLPGFSRRLETGH